MDQQIIAPYEKKYFTMLPNIVDDDASLDTYQFRLLVHYYRVGNCWESVRTTAEKCNMGIGKVSEVRRELAGLGWITLSERENGVIITVVDKWRENMEACSPHEHETQESVLHTNTKCSPHELKNTNTKNNQNNARVREEMGWQQLHAAVAKAMRRSPFMMTEKENELVDGLYASGYTAEQIGRYYGAGGYWRTRDWRGVQNQPLTEAAIRDTIGTCQDFEEHPENYPAETTQPKAKKAEVDAALATFKSLVSRYGWPNWDQAKPVIQEKGLAHVVENLGGWGNACRMSEYDLSRQFATAYKG